MPFGAYKVNSWGGNLYDGPVIPVGLNVTNYVTTLTTAINPNPTQNNYNNQVGMLGYNNGRIYFALGYGSSVTNWASLITVNLATGVTTFNDAASNNTIGNNEISCITQSVINSNAINGSVVNAWNLNSTPTSGRNTTLSITNWSLNTAGTSWAGGNTISANFPISNFEKGRASGIIATTNDTGSSDNAYFISINYDPVSLNNRIQTYYYTGGATPTLVLNYATATSMNIENGIRLTNFYPNSVACNYVGYVGYRTDNTIRLGWVKTNSSTTPVISYDFDPSISYTTKNIMIKAIWDDVVNNTTIAAMQHGDQYIRLIKYSGFSTTSITLSTSQDFLISGTPNTWYRLCSTGIQGLGAIIYYNPVSAPAFQIRFFSINSEGTSLIFGDPIAINTNTLPNMVMMNAEVKYIAVGFCVGIFATDSSGNNRFFSSILWPSNRPFTSVGDQHSYMSIGAAINNNFEKANFGSAVSYGLLNKSFVTLPNFNISKYLLGTGDFTIEFYLAINSSQFILSTGQTATFWYMDSNNYISVTQQALNVIRYKFLWGGVTAIPTTQFTYNQWHHIAVVRLNNSVYFFIDGTQVDVFPDNTDYNLSSLVPTFGVLTGTTQGARSVDEYRVSNIARYTGNFTPLPLPFCNDINTLCLMHFDGAYEQNSGGQTGQFIDDYGPSYTDPV